MKPRDFIRVLEDDSAPTLTAHNAHGRALLELLAQIYWADGRLDDGELAQMRRLSGQVDVAGYLKELRSKPLALDELAALFPDATDRDDIITLLEHAQWGDGDPDLRELDLIEKVYLALGVSRD